METEIQRNLDGVPLPTLFYDGDCGFCDRTIQWVLTHDKKNEFRFAALQGATAEKAIGKPVGDPKNWYIVLVDEDGVSDKSTAALKVAKRIRYAGFLPSLALAIPRPIRDAVYKGVAKVRYRIFGMVNSCDIPSKETRLRFLP